MGEVYLAEDERLGRRVALKFLASHVDGNGDARERLIREARAAALLRSPHIAVTYDLVEYDGALFIAMEYVEGELLSTQIARGPLPLVDGLDIALQLADALDEAHARGIVHRDIKSANVMITDRHLVKVLDFGLAKFLNAPRPQDIQTMASATLPGLVLGTLNYMAPEQLSGGLVDSRADLFSTGVVIYEMLTARLPFAGDSLPEIADRILHHEPDAIARYNYAVPAGSRPSSARRCRRTPASGIRPPGISISTCSTRGASRPAMRPARVRGCGRLILRTRPRRSRAGRRSRTTARPPWRC
jgi:serine/threonine protein kinase